MVHRTTPCVNATPRLAISGRRIRGFPAAPGPRSELSSAEPAARVLAHVALYKSNSLDSSGCRRPGANLSLLLTPSASSTLKFQQARWMMAAMLTLILTGLLRGVRTQHALVLENLALRHQLAVLQRTAPRPRLRPSDRVFWVLLARLWHGWAEVVAIVQPETVIRWQRTGFRLFWTWKSRRPGPGHPAVASDVRALIRTMAPANPLWGAPRIHGELQKLGLEISQATVSKYLVARTPPSQTWRTFLDNHIGSLVPWTSSPCPRYCSRSCSSSSSWRTTGDASSMSTSPTPPPLGGRPSNSWRRSRGTLPALPSCATAMRCTGPCSRAESKP